MLKHLSILIASIMAFSQGSQAGVIPDVTIAGFSSQYASGVDRRHATNLIGNVGLVGDAHTTWAQGSMWLTQPATAGAYTNAYVTFDLGSSRNIDRMKVWNYNEPGAVAVQGRGIQFANILTSDDNVNFVTNKANQLFDKAPLALASFGQTIDLGITARYVRINVITNYGGGENRVGLSKVHFIDDTVVPTVKLATHSLFGNRVTVQFSEAVQRSSATNTANYGIQSGATTATISNATVSLYNDTVTLETSLNTNLIYTLTVSNVRDVADRVTFSSAPVAVEKELTLWLKADEGVVADGSGFVSQWNDQSGLGNNAVQPSIDQQPTLVSGVVNGKPAIHFDGAMSLMEVLQNPTIEANRDLTLYMVLSTDTLSPVPSAQSPISKCPVNVPATFDYQILKAATPGPGKLRMLRGNGSGFFQHDTQAAIQPNEFYLLSFTMKETNAVHYMNGNFNGAAVIDRGLGDSGTPIRLGIRQDAATKFIGNLAEVMLLRGAVSDAEKAALDTYFGDKYGISVVALEITSNPDDTTRFVGGRATFGVTASAGSPTIFYQWQKNNANIPGATNATYTTPVLTLDDNNSTYRAIVSTPLGVNSTSTSATLTVLPDTEAPTIFSAVQQSDNATEIIVNFSEAVDPITASATANYSLNNGAVVTAANIGSSASQIILTTSTLDAGSTYILTTSNVKDAAANTIASEPTLVLPAHLALWVRADSGVIANGANLVNEWIDHSGNGNNARQYGVQSLRPTLYNSSINGEPALHFNGLSNFLEAASSPSLAITGDISIYIVANIADLPVNTGRHFLGKTALNQPASYDYYAVNGGNGMPLYRGNGLGQNGFVRATALPSTGVPHVLSVVMEGTNGTHYLDGVPNGSGSTPTVLGDTGAPLRIGTRNDLAQYMHGEIAEVLLFGAALSDSQRKAIDSYLGYKYFPFSLESPTDLARLEGQTATFSALASAGPASFSYQWQKGTTDIPGATNATYTTSELTLADNGSTYRVIVTPLIGTPIVSDSANLSVSSDQELPTVLSAGLQLWSTNKIVVIFSEAVATSGATTPANYILDNGASVTSAVMGDTPNQVILTVAGLVSGTSYSLTVQDVQDLFNNTISPTPVVTGVYPTSLALWLRADAGVTLDEMNQVIGWADQSGQGNNAFPDVGSAPLFLPTTTGGQPGLSFDGTNNYLVVAHSPSIALVGDLTIYFVAQIRDFTSQANEIGFIGKSGGAGNNLPASFDYYLLHTTGLPRFYRGDGVVAGSTTGVEAPTLGVSHLFGLMMEGQTTTHYLDGLFNGSGVITVPVADSGGPLGIGTRLDLRPKMNGVVQEVMLFSSALSEEERAAIEGYIGAKYGIAIGLAPEITISRGNGGTIILSWPTPTLDFELQSTADLGTPWAAASETVTSEGGVSSVTINAATGNKFYRLQQQ